jgi:hypothetical protein
VLFSAAANIGICSTVRTYASIAYRLMAYPVAVLIGCSTQHASSIR